MQARCSLNFYENIACRQTLFSTLLTKYTQSSESTLENVYKQSHVTYVFTFYNLCLNIYFSNLGSYLWYFLFRRYGLICVVILLFTLLIYFNQSCCLVLFHRFNCKSLNRVCTVFLLRNFMLSVH